MFGFFGKKGWNQYNLREAVINISSVVLDTLGSSFLAQREELSDYTLWVSPDNVFIPPKGFWEDEYILGFINNLIQGLLKVEMIRFGIPNTPENVGKIIGHILKAICSTPYLSVMQKTQQLIRQEPDSMGSEPTSFMLGAMSGGIYAKIITGDISQLENSIQDIVDQAKEISIKTGDPYPHILTFLFKQKTFDSYIKEFYPLEKLREERKNR